MERLADAPISQIVVTDTIPCGGRCGPIENKLAELSVAELIAHVEAAQRGEQVIDGDGFGKDCAGAGVHALLDQALIGVRRHQHEARVRMPFRS